MVETHARELEEQRRLAQQAQAQQSEAVEQMQVRLLGSAAELDQVRRDLEEARNQPDALRIRTLALERSIWRVYVSLSWRSTEWARSLRRHRRPSQLSAGELIPSRQLEPAGENQWTVTATGAHFVAGSLPMSNWIAIDLALWSSVPGRSEIYFDSGAGFTPSQRLDLGDVFGDTSIHVQYRVPDGTRAIKWVPLDRPGTFRLKSWEIRVLPTWLVYARLALRTARSVSFASVLRGLGLLARGRLGEFLLHLRTATPPRRSEIQRLPDGSQPGGDSAASASVVIAEPPPDPAAIRLRLLEIQARPPGINFYSPLSARSGLGKAGRGYQKALAQLGFPMEAHDVPSWKRDDPLDNRLFEAAACPAEAQAGYRINVIHQNADSMPYFIGKYGPGVLKDKYNIGIWVWELPSLRTDWRPYFRGLDEIWTPSEFVRQSVASISPLPVIRIPHIVDELEPLAVHDRDYFRFPADAFIFLYSFDVSSYMERKNPLTLVDAFKRTFGSRKDVLLVLKYHSMTYNLPAVRQMQEAAAAGNIRLLPGVLSDEQAVSLHNVADALVSPHRAEGFGLNIAESMYFGKAVVATGYSGNMDFMSTDNSYPVDYDLVAIGQAYGPYLPGNIWANPKFDDLCEKMKLAFEDESGRRARGEKARETVRRSLGVQAVGSIIKARFEELGLTSDVKESTVTRPRREQIRVPPRQRGVQFDPLPLQPIISVITPVFNVPAEYLEKCIRSVIAQSYPKWELCICDDHSSDPATLQVLERYQGADPRIKIIHLSQNQGISAASNRAVELSIGQFLAMLDNDDELDPDALYWIAHAINQNPLADLIYSDEDKLEPDGRPVEPYFKPDWSPEHLRSVMYLLHVLVVRKTLFLQIGMFRNEFTGAQDYDLALRLSEITENIVHVPRILYHWRKIPGSAAAEVDAKPKALLAAHRALEQHTQRIGLNGQVVPGKLAGMFRIRPAIRGNPPVTLAITTDARISNVSGRGKIDLVCNFVESIRRHTDYPNYRILIVDNRNLASSQRSQLLDSKCEIASYNGPQSPFNFARKANFTFAHVQTEHLVFLNDDMEVIDGDWLSALLELSQLHEIGVVGAKLLTPDQRIQHAGVVLGVNGGAAHVYHGHPADTVGYGGFPNLIRNYSAVTGACMATRKAVIAQVGGFDERFAIDYNDTSFCLAVRKAGYRIVFTPYCQLYHFESITAKRKSQNPMEVELFSRLWQNVLANDPYYNPNLPRGRHDFVLEN